MEDARLLSLINVGRIIAALLVAIGVAGEFAGDWIARPIQRRIEQAKDAEIARFNKEAAEARKTAGEAQERAANAESHLGQANERAARAMEAAASASASTNSLEVEAAEQRERAARAEKDLLELQLKLAPRSLTREQVRTITSRVKPTGLQRIDFLLYPNNPEILGIANQIAGGLQDAGWSVFGFQPLGGGDVTGMLLEVDPNDEGAVRRANALADAFRELGISYRGPFPSLPTPPNRIPAFLGPEGAKIEATIRLTIGPK